MNPPTRLFLCPATSYGMVPLRPFYADHETCVRIALDCSSDVLTKDIEDWCHNAKPGDIKVFGVTMIVALPFKP